jgi:Protein of unknown function (DUF3592)
MWKYVKSSFFFWFGVPFAVFGSIFIFPALTSFLTEREIITHGVAGAATLVEKGHESHPNKDTKYWLKYVFKDQQGKEHVRIADVHWEDWRRFTDGDTLLIRYLPDQPDKNRLSRGLDQPWWVTPFLFGLLAVVFGGLGWAFIAVVVRRAFKETSLLRRGSITEGQIASLDLDYNLTINGRHPQFFHYHYMADGHQYHGRSPNLPLRLTGKWGAGDKIVVVYDPRDPSQSEPDIYNLRRAG